MARKVTWQVAFLGVLGAGALSYAVLRRPRYLYDGDVQLCEGSKGGLLGLEADCTGLFLKRGSGSGKVHAPFPGTITNAGVVSGKQQVELQADAWPLVFVFTLEGGAPITATGTQVKGGEVIAQAERLKVNAFRLEGNARMPMAPSSWLIANALQPTSSRGGGWCEDSSNLVVPHCDGVTFRAPELPKWSFRTVRMSIT